MTSETLFGVAGVSLTIASTLLYAEIAPGGPGSLRACKASAGIELSAAEKMERDKVELGKLLFFDTRLSADARFPARPATTLSSHSPTGPESRTASAGIRESATLRRLLIAQS
jgi:cytochrome c peroxidase